MFIFALDDHCNGSYSSFDEASVFLLPSLCFQDRSRMYDSLNMHSLESSLIDIMRAEQDPMKSE